MTTDSGRVTGSRASVEPASSLAPSGFDPARKCECDQLGQIRAGYEGRYHAELELPFVDHEPGECRCTNELTQYRRLDGSVRWLCSCCHVFGDTPLAIAAGSGTAKTPTAAECEASQSGPEGIAQ